MKRQRLAIGNDNFGGSEIIRFLRSAPSSSSHHGLSSLIHNPNPRTLPFPRRFAGGYFCVLVTAPSCILFPLEISGST
ncbi:hypothetical protein J5N97_012498 [Dioscorea zingiberensis]|uniref:Uncharacterized protein n=1 Tax=Dioscorea zingiberensis TaxID=325984 RepID=A0A9D5CPV2_9LILI|nr:hypothetical protein J5N97_012498 [Dioscorea zingiberensis]